MPITYNPALYFTLCLIPIQRLGCRFSPLFGFDSRRKSRTINTCCSGLFCIPLRFRPRVVGIGSSTVGGQGPWPAALFYGRNLFFSLVTPPPPRHREDAFARMHACHAVVIGKTRRSLHVSQLLVYAHPERARVSPPPLPPALCPLLRCAVPSWLLALCFCVVRLFFFLFPLIFFFFSDELQAGFVLLEGRAARARETGRMLHDIVTLVFCFCRSHRAVAYFYRDGFCWCALYAHRPRPRRAIIFPLRGGNALGAVGSAEVSGPAGLGVYTSGGGSTAPSRVYGLWF